MDKARLIRLVETGNRFAVLIVIRAEPGDVALSVSTVVGFVVVIKSVTQLLFFPPFLVKIIYARTNIMTDHATPPSVS